jgi:hypothetical protein
MRHRSRGHVPVQWRLDQACCPSLHAAILSQEYSWSNPPRTERALNCEAAGIVWRLPPGIIACSKNKREKERSSAENTDKNAYELLLSAVEVSKWYVARGKLHMSTGSQMIAKLIFGVE